MRIHEFKISERQKLKQMHPHLSEQQLDEIIPAIGLAARGAVGLAARGAKAAGSVVGKGAQAAKQGAGRIGQQMGQAGKEVAQSALQKAAVAAKAKASDMMANTILKKGARITGAIAGTEIEIDDVKGDEVTIGDPKNRNAPKTILKKDSPEVQALIAKAAGEQA